MKDVLRNVQQLSLFFFLSLTRSLVDSERGILPGEDEARSSEIERFAPLPTELGFTTLCYEDIPPMSIDVDGAPEVGPVVYGSAGDLSDSQHNPLDDEVKKLREEFFKKHRKPTGQPDQNQQTDGVKNIGKHEIHHGANKEEAVKCERVQKTLGALYNKLNAAHDLMNEDLKHDNLKGNNIIKQHWNAQEDAYYDKKEHLHQHWNGEKIDKQNHKKHEFTIFPKDSGHKNDDIHRELQDEIYKDPYPDVDAIKKNDINLKKNDQTDIRMNKNIQINLQKFEDEEKEIKHNANVESIKKIDVHLNKEDNTDFKMDRNIQFDFKKLQDAEKATKNNVHIVRNLRQQLKNILNLKEKLDTKDLKLYRKLMNVELQKTTSPYEDDELPGPACKLEKEIKFSSSKMDGNIQFDLKKLQDAEKATKNNVHKVRNLRQQLKNILNLKDRLDDKDNFKLYRKLMNVQNHQTTNPYQHDELRGPACKLEKQSNKLKSNLKNNKKMMRLKRGKRNAISTKRRRSGSKKTTELFWDLDGRFRDIEAVERERNEFDAAEANATLPVWIRDDGYRPNTAKKFRPRPPLRYNRVPKEPLDYGSYDKSEFWRYMTELVTGATYPKEWYEIMPTPEGPSTKEIYDACRENFTTSECFQYPDISRLRDTREKRFMKKYYHKKYPELEDEEPEGVEEDNHYE